MLSDAGNANTTFDLGRELEIGANNSLIYMFYLRKKYIASELKFY